MKKTVFCELARRLYKQAWPSDLPGRDILTVINNSFLRMSVHPQYWGWSR